MLFAIVGLSPLCQTLLWPRPEEVIMAKNYSGRNTLMADALTVAFVQQQEAAICALGKTPEQIREMGLNALKKLVTKSGLPLPKGKHDAEFYRQLLLGYINGEVPEIEEPETQPALKEVFVKAQTTSQGKKTRKSPPKGRVDPVSFVEGKRLGVTVIRGFGSGWVMVRSTEVKGVKFFSVEHAVGRFCKFFPLKNRGRMVPLSALGEEETGPQHVVGGKKEVDQKDVDLVSELCAVICEAYHGIMRKKAQKKRELAESGNSN